MAAPGTPTPDPPVAGPPPGWEDPGRSVDSYAPTSGPTNDETATDNDYIEASLSGSPINDDTIGGNVQQAVLLVMDNYGAREQQVHPQGSDIGEAVTLPAPPDRDTTILQEGPGGY